MSQLDDAITALTTKVTNISNVADAATALIQGVPALIAKAVQDALAAGATPAELQAITDLGTALDTKATSLGAAVTAGTPPAPIVPPGGTPVVP